MKKRKLYFLKLGILFFGITILLWNCEKENINIEKEGVKEAKYSVSEINFSDIKRNTHLYQKLEELGKSKKKLHRKDTHNKSLYSSEYDFTVNTDIAKYIQSRDGKYHSYTFPVTRETNNGLLENLLVNLQSDGNYKLFLISYNFTKQEKLEIHQGEHVNLEDKVNFTSINSNVLEGLFSKTEQISCFDIVQTYCEQGNHPGGIENGNACPAQASSIYRSCGFGSGGSARGGNSNDPNDNNQDSDINNRQGGGSSLNNNENDTNEEDEEPILSPPIVKHQICEGGEKIYNKVSKECECPKGMVEDSTGNCVKKPCKGDPVANLEIVSSGSSGKKGGTFGCTRTDNTICEGVSGKKNHNGLDIHAPVNQNAFAMYSGTISSIRNTFSPGEYKENSYGNFIVITTVIDGITYNIKYNHLNTVSVIQGQRINSGDIIGLTGNTGNANNPKAEVKVIPHIHLQVFNSNWSQSLNPEDFLKTKFDSNHNAISNNCQ